MIQMSKRFSHPPGIQHGIPENPSFGSMIFLAINLHLYGSSPIFSIYSFLCFPIFLGGSPACHVDTVKRAPRDRGPNTWAVHDACSIGGLDDQLIRASWDGNSQGAIAFLGAELLSHVRYPATLW